MCVSTGPCLSVCLSICLWLPLSFRLFISVSVCLSLCLFGWRASDLEISKALECSDLGRQICRCWDQEVDVGFRDIGM